MKKCFLTKKGPGAIGPYSTATMHGGAVYVSGMIPVIPETGQLAGETAECQARQVFENVKTVLSEMGVSLADILKTTVFLTDLGDFAAVNAVYAEYFGPGYPARSCVQVAALPMGARIEMECVAVFEEK